MSSGEPDITCKVTPWYFRRMGLMALMFTAFSLWFLYDGKVGWPKENLKAYEKAVVGQVHETWDEFEEEERLEAWPDGAAQRVAERLVGDGSDETPGEKEAGDKSIEEVYAGIVDGEGGFARYLDEEKEPIRWDSFAADRKWKSKPKFHTKDDVQGQFRWAAGALVFAGVVGVIVLLNFRKVLKSDPDAYITDKGERIPWNTVFEVDTRKWAKKGLAYFRYRVGDGADDAESGEFETKRGVIDDLKYGGAQQILDRMLENFEGDLIEAVPDDDEDDDDEGDDEEELDDEAGELAEARDSGGGS